MRLKCPHCNARANIRTSRDMGPLSGSARYQCSNVECGHTFKVLFEITETLSPSAMPNPSVVLPLFQRKAKEAAQ